MQTAHGIRRRAWLLIGVGGVLLALMTALIAVAAFVIVRSGEPGASNRFDGGSAMNAFAFGALGLVWVFGLTALENGIWLLRYGKRNRLLVRLTLGICLALWLLGLFAQFYG